MTKYSDELYHFKYLKRERVNGKWKYYYDWDELKSDAKDKARDVLGYDNKEEYRNALAEEQNIREKRDIEAFKSPGTLTETEDEYIWNVSMSDVYMKLDDELKVAKRETERVYNNYKQTPIGAAETIAKGVKTVLNSIFKVENKNGNYHSYQTITSHIGDYRGGSATYWFKKKKKNNK